MWLACYGIHHGLLKVTQQFSQVAKTVRKVGNIQLANITLFSSAGGLWEGELLLVCSPLLSPLSWSWLFPGSCRAPVGWRLEEAAQLVRLSWRGVLRFPEDKERRGGRVKRFGSLHSAWLPVSRLGGFPFARTSFDASRLHLARDILFLSSPRSAKVLSPKTPLLDEVLGKRLSWHPLTIYNPSLLLRETVSCRGFPGRGLCRLGSPPSPPKIANTWSSCSILFTSELKTTATYCSQEVFPW